MTNEEQEMIDLKFDKVLIALENLSNEQSLKDQNIMLHITGLSARIDTQMDMLTLTANRDRKDLLETRDNTRLTNGRVTKLEKEKNDHIVNCPQEKKIEQIKKDIEDLTFFQRHPALLLTIVIALIIVTFYFK